MKHLKPNSIKIFIKKLFKTHGASNYTIKTVSEGLILASMRGVDSHGINLIPHYLDCLINGRKNGNPNFSISSKYPSSILLNADHAFGLTAGDKAINLAMKCADKYGISQVGVLNSSHCGSLASTALNAAKKNYCIFAFTNADALVNTFNASNSFFGTNPICFSSPSHIKNEPFCLDMSQSNISWNKLLNHKHNNEMLDDYFAVDHLGNSTNDPNKAKGLLPIGGYKGYGLASMVDILCGVILKNNFGSALMPMYNTNLSIRRKIGQHYILFKTDCFMSTQNFKKRMREMYELLELHSIPKKNKKVILPGQKEQKIFSERLKTGIPVSSILLNNLMTLSKKYKINLI